MSPPPRPDLRAALMEMQRPSQSAASPASQPRHALKPAPSTTPQQVAAAAAALAASRAATVSAAVRSVFNANATAAAATATANAAAAARAVAAVTQQPTKPAATAPVKPAAAPSSVVVQGAFDGLPALPSHTGSCEFAATAMADAVPRDGDVSLYGEPSTRSAVRKSLVQFYAATNQLASGDGTITEMTLRVDTELEMLRRQCFAERNARWQYQTPDMFTFALAAPPQWTPTPYVGPRKKMLLYRKRVDHQRLRSESERLAAAVDSSAGASYASLESEQLLQSFLGVELVRDRPWPPKEFVAKAATKPSRGGAHTGSSGPRTSAGKKKALGMVGVVDETPTQSLVCSECATQRSALWRKRPRRLAAPLAGTVPAATVPATATATTVAAPLETLEDVCLPCYLKTERRDLFEKKAAEKVRLAKEQAARVAAEARQQKKQQQQLQKKLKKMATAAPPSTASTAQQVKEEVDELEQAPLVAVVEATEEPTGNSSSSSLRLKFRRESLSDPAATFTLVEEKKKKDKKSKKDKKKKKKKDKKKKKTATWDDSDSDDDGHASSVVLPSPPQRQMDGFVYADRTTVPAITTNDTDRSIKTEIDTEADSKRSSSSSSSNKRHASSSSSSRSGSSKKRKTTVDEETEAALPPATPSSSSRNSRAKAATATTTATVAPSSSASSRKRARPTKKETARERELRALGQYCPVCNLTYEEDDASPFVCCDSCEMWIHAACDPTLSAETLATLADATVKYTCPLCSGR